MNDKLKSALVGLVIAIPLTAYALNQQELNAAEHINDFKPEPKVVEVETVEEVQEEKIEYYDTELSHELQDIVFEECEKHNISPALVIAMIERESGCNPLAISADGSSTGLMQIQARWHIDRMTKLGCTDLLDARQNITVGVDYLHELFQQNEDVFWVLMTYNGGKAYSDAKMASGNYSAYAVEVTERAKELEGCECQWNWN